MPVDLPDLDAAAAACDRELAALTGRPGQSAQLAILDVVHLGLGADGHMASLFPGDPALGIQDRNVAVVGPHAGYRRLTLTLPVINAARNVVWFVTGAAKRAVLTRLMAGGATFPAGRVDAARACAFADEAAAPAG
jgi:6-phosphogluconolactonase